MPDPMSLVGALDALRTAGDIVRGIRAANAGVEAAEMKLKVADLATALADARMGVLDAQEDLQRLKARIGELEHALQTQAEVARAGDAIYRVDESGRPVGDPFCLRCWELEHRLLSLVQSASTRGEKVCPKCQTRYGWGSAQRLAPPAAEA